LTLGLGINGKLFGHDDVKQPRQHSEVMYQTEIALSLSWQCLGYTSS